jgi:hypothetical protein
MDIGAVEVPGDAVAGQQYATANGIANVDWATLSAALP